MGTFTQLIGEKLFLQQDVVNDTISAAAWSSDPSASISSASFTATSAKAEFESDVPGIFIVTVQLTLASGQIAKGQARINVVDQKV